MCRAILETGEMRDNWEPWVTDLKRVLDMLELVLRVFNCSCSSGNLGPEGGQGWRKGKVLLGTQSWAPLLPLFNWSVGQGRQECFL